jgi:hypothetical protein
MEGTGEDIEGERLKYENLRVVNEMPLHLVIGWHSHSDLLATAIPTVDACILPCLHL